MDKAHDRREYFRQYNARPERREAQRAWSTSNRSHINDMVRARRKADPEKFRQYWRDYRKAHPGLEKKYRKNPEQKKANLKIWCARNPDKRKASARKYRALHPDRVAQRTRAYREKHGDHLRKKQREYAARNREKRLAKAKEYYRKRYDSDPSFRLAFAQAANKRRALRSSVAVNPQSIAEFMSGVKAKRFAVCYYCKKVVSTKRIEFDHIMPLSKGGPHSIENICVACHACNRTKHAKLLKDFITLGQQLLEL